MSDASPVLIVGAGPTGLALGLFLAKCGVRARIVEKNSGPGQTSRAMAMQARTLEFYRQLDLGDEMVSRGIPIRRIAVRAHGSVIGSVDIADFGTGISPYPFVLSFPQDEQERMLVAALSAAGVEVDWGTELVALKVDAIGAAATLARPGADREQSQFRYVCGCDGAGSLVRRSLGLAFEGATYEQRFFVADVHAVGEATTGQSFTFCLNGDDFVICLPVRSSGMSRLIGIVPSDLGAGAEVGFDAVRDYVERAAGIEVRKVNWFSTYRVHHRVSEKFRVGSAFLCGDAAHIHSPAGGQGMNTGVGDAVNLAWKLAAAIGGKAHSAILRTYEIERMPFARSLVATTDRLFQIMTGSSGLDHLIRERLFPHVMPVVFGFRGIRSEAFRRVSQSRISYRASPLSSGRVGDIHGGDRLPWVSVPGDSDNYAPLRSFDWQLHHYCDTTADSVRVAAAESKIPLHEFAWTEHTLHAGIARGSVFLIRPDGYVSVAAAETDANRVRDMIAAHRIAPSHTSAGTKTTSG